MLIILSPVYNDWESYDILTKECRILLVELNINYKFVAVDDCSHDLSCRSSVLGHSDLEIVELSRNMGHQKAIVIGLAYIYDNYPEANVVVMDSDGEDKPKHIIELFKEGSRTGKIVFAKRSQRSEGNVFVAFYKLYKFVFVWLTGHTIDFGNFSFIPNTYLKKVVSLSEIWNHFSVGILRTKLPFFKIPLERGKRYKGKSKMNFYSLITHGLSAISVYTDVVATRLIIFSILAIMVGFIGIFTIIMIKTFTEIAIPGWATTVTLGLSIIIFQAFFMALFLAFSVLSSRSQVSFIPYKDYQSFINNVLK